MGRELIELFKLFPEQIKSICKKYLAPHIRVIALIGVATMMTFIFFQIRKYWNENHWYFTPYNNENEMEMLSTDIPMKSGTATIQSQIVISYQNVIIHTLNICNYYDVNEAQADIINNGNDGNKAEFSFFVDAEQKEKLENLKETFMELLKSRIGEEEIKKCKIYDAHLIRVGYFAHDKGDNIIVRFLYATGEGTRVIQEREVQIRDRDNSFNLDSFHDKNTLKVNEDIMRNIESCANRIS